MREKTVLILVNHDVVIYNFRLELVEELLKQNYNVIISSPYGERIDELKKIGAAYIEATIDRHGKNPLKEIILYKYYINIIKELKPDVVLTYTIKPNIYGAMAAAKFNVSCIANITGLGSAVENKGIMQSLTVLLYKVAFRKINTVFFQNDENKLFFENKKIAIGKHKLLPGSGVNLKRFSVLEYPNEATVEFVFISRIMKEKGIEQYLKAAEYIRSKMPNTRFHICGFCEEEYADKLDDYQKRGIIIYHGMLRDVREIIREVHCTVHPTYYPEGLSNVLLESCACGRPIITTDRSGCREVVEDGKNGYMVLQKDTNSLIDAIEKFIALSYKEKYEMGLYGRKKVEKEFDRNIVVEAYMKEIKSGGK